MSPRVRMGMFVCGGAGLAALLVWGLAGLPAFGAFNGAYALLVDHVVVAQRHATDAVTAVNFDYRALDTLGEEFILFTSVAGLAVLLREQRGERERPSSEASEEHRLQGTSYALRALTLALVGIVLTLSLYVDSHGALTPGGGFQGGVMSVVQSSTYVLLLSIGYRNNAAAPIFADIPPGSRAVDPVVQALTLTDVVVEATVVALLLALAVQAHKRFGTLDPAELTPLRG